MKRKKFLPFVVLSLCCALLVQFTSFAAAGKWVLKNGYWMLEQSNKTYLKKSWYFGTDNNWYYLDDDGHMRTGWHQINSKWYNFTINGQMRTGWYLDKGQWFYLKPSGEMQTGWLRNKDQWFYLNESNGAMQTGWLYDKNHWYYLTLENGNMYEGWLKTGETWYYLTPNSGIMHTGWMKSNDAWYYLASNGSRVENQTIVLEQKEYRFDVQGKWQGSGDPTTVTANPDKPKTNFQMGSWKDAIYQNQWSNVTFSLPAGAKYLSDSQMKDVLGIQKTVNEGEKIVVDRSMVNESFLARYAGLTYYDLYLQFGSNNANLQLYYTDIRETKQISEAEYAAQIAQNITSNHALSYVNKGIQTTRIAETPYTQITFSAMGNTLHQDFYLRKLDGFMIVFQFVYSQADQADMTKLLSLMKVLN
ncbi:hypothetical protein FACS189418_8070 [Clostridia bacterium]|nr:hypothetical protein FACS189418_8070 [Clostridia bacterium]